MRDTGRLRITQLPFRARLVICLLYMTALGLTFTGVTIAWLHGSGLGVGLGCGLETLLLLSLIRRGLCVIRVTTVSRRATGRGGVNKEGKP